MHVPDRLRPRHRILTRLLDVTVALALLPVLLVAAVVLVPLIRIESRGSALFKQIRVGQHERPIGIYKFRTLRADIAEVPTHELGDGDVTRVGRRLRSTKIDELPQILNVLLGSMSLVGPRPSLPSQHDVIAARRREGVFVVRPGITGWAQLCGVDMSTPDFLAEIDRLWIETGTLTDDLRTLLATAPGPVRFDRSFDEPPATHNDSGSRESSGSPGDTVVRG